MTIKLHQTFFALYQFYCMAAYRIRYANCSVSTFLELNWNCMVSIFLRSVCKAEYHHCHPALQSPVYRIDSTLNLHVISQVLKSNLQHLLTLLRSDNPRYSNYFKPLP